MSATIPIVLETNTTTAATTVTVVERTLETTSFGTLVFTLVGQEDGDATRTYSWTNKAIVSNKEGVASIVIEGTPVEIDPGTVAPTVALDISGTNVRLRVTGIAGETWKWAGSIGGELDVLWPIVDQLRAILGANLVGVWPLYGDQLVINESNLPNALDLSTWSQIRCTCTTGHADPDGGSNAGAVIEDNTAGASHIVYQLPNVTVGPLGLYLRFKAGARGYAGFANGVGNIYCFWNATTGAVTSSTNCTGSTAVSLGSGWFEGYVDFPTWLNPGTSLVLHWSTDGTYAGRLYDGVLGQTAGYFYNPEIIQASIVTAPNLLGALMLATYGDRFDLVNATKASQPVLTTLGWGSVKDCGTFTAANWLAADTAAALATGTDTPIVLGSAHTTSTIAATSARVFAIASSSSINQYYNVMRTTAARRIVRRDDALSIVDFNETAAYVANSRTIRIDDFTGTQLNANNNTAEDASNPFSCNVGALTLDRFTVGALRNNSSPTGSSFWAGKMVVLFASTATLSAANRIAVAQVLANHCPIT